MIARPLSSQAAVNRESETLLGATTKMDSALSMLENINLKANFIALNAAIEAARSQSQTENFALVADQVSRQAQRTEELAEKLRLEIRSLQRCALRATAVRYADISSDLIDKIDRNLFERNCDCQAWATFSTVVEGARATVGLTPERIAELASAENAQDAAARAMAAAAAQLKLLLTTYMVYEDVFLLNKEGVIIAAGKRSRLVGADQSRADYFRQVRASGKAHVTEMHRSPLTGDNSVGYTAPVVDEEGRFLGAVSTRFNWSFVQEMIDKMPLAKDCRAYVISREGIVLASTGKRGILRDDLSWLLAGEEATSGGSGFSIECARNGRPTAWGYCHTRGFAAYPGKGWSAVVCHPVELREPEFFQETIARDGESHLFASELANNDLVNVSANIRDLVTAINMINNETNMLAVNASIQAGVAGADGESFSVIASEIGRLAKQSEEFVRIVNSLTESLGHCVQSTVAARLADAAFDTIDKIDRNLFERYCDIQAFAAFEKLAHCAKAGENDHVAQDLLQKAHAIYEVYHDIFVLDAKGNIVSAAVRTDLVAQNQADRDWFRECSRGAVVVTDFYFSRTINNYTMTFAAPLRDAGGQFCGVVTTRFNGAFLMQILKAAIVGAASRAVLLNAKGVLIGNTTGEGLLEENMSGLRTFKALDSGTSGFLTERIEGQNRDFAIGYARTPGYNSYKGKGWSVLVLRPTDTVKPEKEAVVIPIR
jgi:hypothetical protein